MRARTLIVSAALIMLASVAAACGSSSTPEATATATSTPTQEPTASPTAAPQTPTPSPTATSPIATPSPTPTATPEGFPLSIYFSRHPASDDDPSAVFPVDRLAPDSGVARYAITQVLAGPTTAEQADGYFSTWTNFAYGATSDCGATFELDLNGATGVLTVRFCTSVALLGVIADGQAETVMTQTLLQFSTVSRVVILGQDNHCLFNASGLDLCLEP